MANGGGSINLRLSLKGADQVKQELQSIGPAGSRMARDLDRAMRQPGPGIQALDAGMKSARGGLEGFAGRIGPVGTGLSGLGAAGLAVATGVTAAIAATAAAVQEATAAMRFADDIEDAAGKINIGVEALQEWRFAAAEAGATAEDADAAIDGFQRKLGEAMAGGRAAKWFERLGFSASDLKAFEGTEDALDAVIDRIAGLGTEAERAAVADKLGLSPLIPLVRQGADAIDEMRARARELGIVMDEEMIKRGAQASREMEVLAEKIDMQLKQAFIDMGPAIVWVMGLVGQLASAINNLTNSWKSFELKSTDYLQREDQRLARGITNLMARSGANNPAELSPSERALFDRMNARRGRIASQLSDRATERAADTPAAPVPPVELRDLSGGKGGGGADRARQDAERRTREVERLYEQLERELMDARRDATRGRWDGDSPEERAQLAQSMAALDRQERDRALAAKREDAERLGQINERSGLYLEQIAALHAESDRLEDEAIIRQQTVEQEKIRRDIEGRHADLTAQILDIASAGARTAAERQQIEADILAIAQRQRRRRLEQDIADAKSDEERRGLQDLLARLPQLDQAERDESARRNAGPVGRWWDAQPQSAAEVTEGLTANALSALDDLNGGLIDVFKNARSAGEAFDMMGAVGMRALQSIVDSLLEVAIQTLIVKPLVSGLFGDPKGGGGGILGSFLGNIAGSFVGGGKSAAPPVKAGKAWGGLNSSRGLMPVGEFGTELVDLPVGSRIYDTERSERMMLAMGRGQPQGYAPSPAPVVNLTANVINRTSEPVSARVRQTPEGLDVILEPMVRNAVNRMGSDGSLAKANALTPGGTRR